MPTPADDHVVVGDHVKTIKGHYSGIVRFIGETQFQTGVWVGIELEAPEGKNDGSVDGVTYFSCKPKYGIFARLEGVERTNRFRVGQATQVFGHACSVSFIGTVHFDQGLWLGVEFGEPVGISDGTIGGVLYFQCKPGHGLFLQAPARIADPDAGCTITQSPMSSPIALSSKTSSPFRRNSTLEQVIDEIDEEDYDIVVADAPVADDQRSEDACELSVCSKHRLSEVSVDGTWSTSGSLTRLSLGGFENLPDLLDQIDEQRAKLDTVHAELQLARRRCEEAESRESTAQAALSKLEKAAALEAERGAVQHRRKSSASVMPISHERRTSRIDIAPDGPEEVRSSPGLLGDMRRLRMFVARRSGELESDSP
jgi:hypothetical protein